ncbi:heat shock protein HslJ [Kribbella sp. VKM Ac-2571]|uniref:META domain-containing protein n=1 Tax=Kribbella sp. VKM Ac-2571 TaxID=2512222 RepID=UPI00105C5525|nr:META domain-containing protein [Kribbella sp. VKM Ac-2571]TDO68105.1 heat shock protein HslJ [Kribbella sp. VKM Ac-2571]
MIALAGTGLLLLSACGNDVGTGGSGTGGSLTGRTFLSTSVTENEKPRPLVAKTQVRLEFTTDGRLSWDAGCNSSQTSVSTSEGKLSLGKEIMSTLIGCMGAQQAQDSWIAGVLSAKPTWKLDGDKLVLSTESTTISLLDKETAQPDLALDGTKWKLTTVVSGESASHQAGFEKVWLTLNGERVTGSTGCNEFQGVVAHDTGKVTFGELATTRRACAGDAATVESLVLKGLKGELTYQIDGSTLQLRSAAGGLDFTAAR